MVRGKTMNGPEPETGASSVRPPVTSVDDLRVVAEVEEYAAKLRAGEQVDRQALLDWFPRIAAALAECLNGLEFVQETGPALGISSGEENGPRS